MGGWMTTWTVLALSLAGIQGPGPGLCSAAVGGQDGELLCRHPESSRTHGVLKSELRPVAALRSLPIKEEPGQPLLSRDDTIGVEAAEGAEAAASPDNASPSSVQPESTTEIEDYAPSDGDSDLGGELLNILLDIVGTLISLFTDPPGAIAKMLDQAKELFGGARSAMKLGPEGARQARLMLNEANRILESARRIMLTTNKIANTARQVAGAFSRPWLG